MFDICFGPSLELPISEDDGFVEHNVLPTDLFFFFLFYTKLKSKYCKPLKFCKPVNIL